MRLIDIEIENKVIIKFKYKDRPFSMNVDIISKDYKHIVIPSILENNQVVDPSGLSEVEIIYTVKDGIFHFESIELETSMYQGMRVYLASSDNETARVNRREAYRVFIGELVKINVMDENGVKKDLEGVLKNISVLGMGLILKNELEIGTTMSIIYNYEGLNMHLLGKVVRKEKVKRYKAYQYGCLFKEPNNAINRVITLKQIKSKNENTE
ncbi:MAG: PilZ domain-containing protein [Mobilitalea sp.]